MASGIPILGVWSDLPQAGGTLQSIAKDWSDGKVTLAEDGDDRLTFKIKASDPAVLSLLVGSVVQLTYDDAEVEEWVVQVAEDHWPNDAVTITCTGARTWLGEQVLIYNPTPAVRFDPATSVVAYEGSAADVLTQLYATPDWPAWVTTGTIEVNEYCTISCNKTTGLGALVALVEAANDSRAVGEAAYVLKFRRASDTSYVVDIISTPTASTAHVTPGKNLTSLVQRTDRREQRTSVLAVDGSGQMTEGAFFRFTTYDAPVGSLVTCQAEPLQLGEGPPMQNDGDWDGLYCYGYNSTTLTNAVIQSSAIGSGPNEVDLTFLDADINQADQATEPGTIFQLFTDAAATMPFIVQDSGNTGYTPRRGFLETGGVIATRNWAGSDPHFRVQSGGVPTEWTQSGTDWATDTTIFETAGQAITLDGLHVNTTLHYTTAKLPKRLRDGGATEWVVGVRVYGKGAGDFVIATVADISAASWENPAATATCIAGAYSWVDAESVPSTLSDSTYAFKITIKGYCSAGNTLTVDRVWIHQVGVDDGNNYSAGTKSSTMLYDARNRYLAPAGGNDGDPPIAYQIGFVDLYRDDPTAYPNDEVAPFSTIRLEHPGKGVDVAVRVVRVERSLNHPDKTTLELGTPRRRLTGLQ